MDAHFKGGGVAFGALSLLFISLTSCTDSVSQEETVPRDYAYPSLEKLWEPFLSKLEASRTAPEQPCTIPLWIQGAPGFEDRRDEPELAKSYWVKNIHSPSLTAYLPAKDKATGDAVIICPGGGHVELVFGIEGQQPAKILQERGIAAFVLKYRLQSEPRSPYRLDEHGRQDAHRAMRLVRSLPESVGVNSQRIGMLGFSAGGGLISLVAYESGEGEVTAADPVDRLNGQPNMVVMVYAGIGGTPKKIPQHAPPALLVAAKDDRAAHRNMGTLAKRYQQANLPHKHLVFKKGGHGFSFGQKSSEKAIQDWPNELVRWMSQSTLPTR